MSDIVLSAGVRANLLQLQQTSNLINTTQTDLATGKKVNSALDNAISFFTAQSLDHSRQRSEQPFGLHVQRHQHDPGRQ